MDQVSTALNGFANVMDQNIRGVQLGCYSVALAGLTIAVRKVRPFSKFKSPSDIPNHFIKERRELTGLVRRIDPNGALLMVQHKPLVNIPLVPSGQLPVKISGVNVSGLGINWLQAVVVGSEVKFVPVLKQRDAVECEVMLLQETKDRKRFINLGENLVKIGFGLPAKPPVKDPKLLSYYKQLQSAELYAIRKKLGVKYYLTPMKNALHNLFDYLVKTMFDTVEQKKKQQPLRINVGENLVRIGFGMTDRIDKPLVEDPVFSRYYERLKRAERYAIRKKLGLRYYIKPTKEVLVALGVYLNLILRKAYQKASKLPYKLPKIYAS
ncbi:hypothetical protein NQ315_009909 [Exocentrus adspersus]|uniref:Uncharacterized protein n=1 Tax=Exocentrus adspersus TaxID=1586481 RepID=A0AAV8WHN3_9CUCU|nr:hypothetical protein NQ315_009909 [Exocentrus adspersus]